MSALFAIVLFAAAATPIPSASPAGTPDATALAALVDARVRLHEIQQKLDAAKE